MTKSTLFLTLCLLALLGASCAPDPRRQADADATRTQAQSQAASDAQARQIKADKHALWMEQVQAAKPFITAAVQASLIALMFAVVVSLASLGIGMSTITISAGFATAKRNMERPNQIHLDKSTHQFPLLITRIDEGRYTLTNPNTNSVTYLNERNDADKLMIQAMASTQFIGEIGTRASLSHKPEAIASIQTLPVIVDMEN